MKRKWFTRDAFARREQLTDLPAIDDLDTYVRDVLHVQAHRMPSFRRIRYDVNVESLATGSYYGVFYDHCHIEALPDAVLCQCEIEYCRTRGTQPPPEADVLAEINLVAGFAQAMLARRGITTGRSFFSKLSFLRHAVDDSRKTPIA